MTPADRNALREWAEEERRYCVMSAKLSAWCEDVSNEEERLARADSILRLLSSLDAAEKLAEAAKDMLDDSGVEMDDERMKYMIWQVYRQDRDALRAALDEWEGKK